MNEETYYRDHWLEVDAERLESYEQMFAWRPQMAPLLEPAGLAAGQTVLDYGCGPGQLALELARRVGESGRVLGFDINRAFVERTRAHAETEGLAQRIEARQFDGRSLPLEDKSVDRVICKNVLEYVDDLGATLAEMRRVLRPGGRVHAIDSDWGMLVVEPLGIIRSHQGLEVADLGVGETGEQHRIAARLAVGLDPVLLVVEPDANDLLRPGQRRQEGNVVECRVRALAGERLELADGTPLEHRGEARILAAEPGADVDHAAVDGDAVGLGTAGRIGHKLHVTGPLSFDRRGRIIVKSSAGCKPRPARILSCPDCETGAAGGCRNNTPRPARAGAARRRP